MKRTLRALLAVAAVAGATLTATASPAVADGEPLILYEHSGYKGYPSAFWDSEVSLSWWTSDSTSSVANYSSVAWVLYDDRYFEDRRYCIRPGERVERLGDAPWKFNDKISSIKKLSGPGCEGYPPFYNVR